MSLRRRLFVRVFLPVAAVYLLLGALGAMQVRNTLISNLEDDLVLTSGNAASLLAPLTTDEIVAVFGATRESQTPQLSAIIDVTTGSVTISPSARSGSIDPAPDEAAFAPGILVRGIGEPFTVDSADGTLEYRAVTQRIDGGRLVVTAEPVDRIDDIFRQLLFTVATTGLLILGALAGVIYLVVRSALRPVDGFIDATTRIADGDLTERIDLDATDPTFQRIGAATNHMLDQLEAGFDRQHQSRQRLGELITGIAHELRTPLAGIRGTVDMQRMGMLETPDAAATAFGQLDHQSKRMVDMVDDLLTIARAENAAISHGDALAAQPGVDLAAVAEAEVRRHRAANPERSIEFSSAADACLIRADSSQLQAAICSVLSNAVRHTPNSAAISVSVDPAPADGWIRLEIADAGPGMSIDVADQVFDPFFRADPSRARDSGGTGLGLTIARATVESLGGFISLITSPDHGSTFALSFPCVTGAALVERAGREG